MSIMIARNHDYWHRRSGNLFHCEIERLATYPIRIEQVTDNQQKVSAIAIRNIDYTGKSPADDIAEDITSWSRTEGITLKMNVRGMYKLKPSRNGTSHSHLRLGRCRQALSAPPKKAAIVTIVSSIDWFNRKAPAVTAAGLCFFAF